MPHRLSQLYIGLMLYGFSIALMVRGDLGLMPWSVLDQGVSLQVGWSLGVTSIATSVVVLLLWLPLRQRPGFGTVSNVIVIGVSLDLALWLLPDVDSLALRIALMVAGVVMNGVATALYIGASFGPGPRDGLMTGLTARTGWSVRLVRTSLEVAVVASGWLLGGTVGVATVLYALAIGPLVQVCLPRMTRTSRRAARVSPAVADAAVAP